MFFGEYHHQMDDKGRIRIPTRISDELGKDAMMMIGSEKCLMLYTRDAFENRVCARIMQEDILNPNSDDIKRGLFSRAFPIEEDKQGRVTLTPVMIKACGFKKNVVTIGAMDHAEIWDEQEYEKYMAALDLKSVLRSAGSKTEAAK